MDGVHPVLPVLPYTASTIHTMEDDPPPPAAEGKSSGEPDVPTPSTIRATKIRRIYRDASLSQMEKGRAVFAILNPNSTEGGVLGAAAGGAGGDGIGEDPQAAAESLLERLGGVVGSIAPSDVASSFCGGGGGSGGSDVAPSLAALAADSTVATNDTTDGVASSLATDGSAPSLAAPSLALLSAEDCSSTLRELTKAVESGLVVLERGAVEAACARRRGALGIEAWDAAQLAAEAEAALAAFRGNDRCVVCPRVPECTHYKTTAFILAACCGKLYACRFCHDDNELHKIDRFATTTVQCQECGRMQGVQEQCEGCGTRFATSFCAKCNLYTEHEEIFHCDKCGFCRHGAAGEYFHCNTCSLDIRVTMRGEHNCAPYTTASPCAVCHEELRTSTR